MTEKIENIRKKGFGTLKIGQNSDERGSLAYAEWGALPFEPRRIFWIYDVKDGQTRGSHAHSQCEEVVFAVKGSFDMFVDNGTEQATYHMDSPSEGIYIGKSVWCELRNFAPGTVCVVVASVPYMRDGYINSYDDFKSMNA